MPVWQKDLRKLSNLIVDTDKDWLGYIIKNLGAIQIPRTDDPATLLEGLLWYRKDTDEWKYSPDGTNIKILGDWAVISDLTVDSDCDYVEWTGLDINRDGAYIILADIKNPTESGASCHIYINGNMTDTNYYNQYIEANGTSIIGGRGNNPGGPYVPAGSECFAVIWVMRDPTGHARTLRLMSWNTPDAVRLTVGTDVTVFTVSNITSIRIQTTQAGGIGAGSRFILCRVKSP